MKTIHAALACALAASPVLAQLPTNPSVFPRVFSASDDYSPTGVLGWYTYKCASPRQALPAAGGMPSTANFVHLSYGDTDNFVPQYEYRYSTNGGFTWSDPTVIHKLTTGEVVDDNKPRLVCDERNVFFVFQSNLTVPGGGANFAVYAYGSNDMGKTWQGPLLMSPGFAGTTPTLNSATPELDAAAAGGRLHVVYEAHIISNAGGNEECFYANAEFDANGKFVLVKGDVNISNLPNPTAIDIDAPHIAADGKIVAVIWLDDRASGSATTNETFVRVSRDAGTTFDKEVDVSEPNTTPLASSADVAWVAVSAQGQGSIYCTYQDMRTGTGGDNLYLMFSKDGGTTWIRTDNQSNRIMLNKNIVDDVDQVQIGAFGSTLAVAWMVEVPPAGRNVDNQLKVIVDPLGGLGWTTGAIPPVIDLSAGTQVVDVQIVEKLDIKNGVIAIAHEANSPEAAALSWSCDYGQTWRTTIVNDGKVDVDEPYVDVSLNGDINMTYLEDKVGGQKNTTVVTGLKVPTLENDQTASQGIKMTCAARSVGYTAMALFSGATADMKGNGPIQFDNMGFSVSLVPDIAYSVGVSTALSMPAVYFGTVDAKGEMTLPGILNFSSLLGVDIYCAVGTAQIVGSSIQLGEFTDPVKLR